MLYLIKRAPKPDYHKAPYHQVIVCDRKDAADWEAGNTGKRAWVWVAHNKTNPGGWLLKRWEGLDIDYRFVVASSELPDGSRTGFWRHYDVDWNCVKPFFAGAVWWSPKVIPEWLRDLGVVYAPDKWTQDRIAEFFKIDIRPMYWPKEGHGN
jgi:hypothetical protein